MILNQPLQFVACSLVQLEALLCLLLHFFVQLWTHN